MKPKTPPPGKSRPDTDIEMRLRTRFRHTRSLRVDRRGSPVRALILALAAFAATHGGADALQDAAGAGDQNAQLQLGVEYLEGYARDFNPRQALKWW